MSAQRRAAAKGADRDDAMFPNRLQLCFELSREAARKKDILVNLHESTPVNSWSFCSKPATASEPRRLLAGQFQAENAVLEIVFEQLHASSGPQ
eukprot:5785933-Amphidinium_carterae.1